VHLIVREGKITYNNQGLKVKIGGIPMVDLSTKYLGLQLKNPLVASASPLSKKLDGIRTLEDAGIGGIVMYSDRKSTRLNSSHP
jgi:hypothetical protein